TIGVLPTPEETRTFLAEQTPGKRDHLIDALLARPEFVDYWAYKWSDLLLVNGDKLPVQPMWTYYQWIRRQVELNTPWDVLTGDLVPPLRGKPQLPTPLDAQPMSLTSSEDRRAPLAKWLTAPENPYFSRSITNRVWKNFFSVALVESVDDLRMTNPASNEKLL